MNLKSCNEKVEKKVGFVFSCIICMNFLTISSDMIFFKYLVIFLLFISAKCDEGFQVSINGVSMLIPYGKRASYLKVCTEHNILPIEDCANSFEEKGLERLTLLENLYILFYLIN